MSLALKRGLSGAREGGLFFPFFPYNTLTELSSELYNTSHPMSLALQRGLESAGRWTSFFPLHASV